MLVGMPGTKRHVGSDPLKLLNGTRQQFATKVPAENSNNR
jgi:hypothetical protein